MVFGLTCPLDGQLLATASHIRRMWPGPEGLSIQVRCACGYEGVRRAGKWHPLSKNLDA